MSEDWTEKPGRWVMGAEHKQAVVDELPEFHAAAERADKEANARWGRVVTPDEFEAARERTEKEHAALMERVLLREALAAEETHRSALLQDAERIITTDRNNTHGDPHQDFARTAAMLTAMGFCFDSFAGTPVGEIEPHHVAMILGAVKLSRLSWNPANRDSWVDLAGYAACGYEAYELDRDSE